MTRRTTKPRQPGPPTPGHGKPTVSVPRPSAADSGRTWVRAAGPAVFSAVMHVIVLLLLAMMFVAVDAKPERPVIISGASEDEIIDDSVPVELDTDISPPEETEQATEVAELPSLDVEPMTAEAIAVESLAAAAPSPEPAGSIPADFSAGDMLASIGGAGTAAAGTGRGGGGGGGSGGGGGGAATFFGQASPAKNVCFICDNSPSYRDGGFHMVLAEVARAIESLRPGQSFFVIFYSDAAYPMFHPEPVDQLQPATAPNKQRLQTWLATVELCSGGVRGLREAVKIATGLNADVVYFLSDGRDFDAQKRCMLSADFGTAVVHTFGMQQNPFDRRTGKLDPDKVREQQGCNQHLVDIAEAFGGTFTPVQVPPDAAALERLRPIRKNFTRGSVWGTKIEK